MKELIERFKAEIPIFWKRVQHGAIAIGTSAIAVLTVNTTFALALPASLITILGYSVAICAAVAGTAQLTKKDSDAKV